MDSTTLVAIAGIAGTLLAPIIAGRMQRSLLRADRVLDRRLDAYVDLLRLAACSSASSELRPGPFAPVDEVLVPPVVDGLIAHAEISGDVGDLPSGRDQVKDPAPELRRVPPRHADLLMGVRGMRESNMPAPPKWGNIKVSMEPRAIHSMVSSWAGPALP